MLYDTLDPTLRPPFSRVFYRLLHGMYSQGEGGGGRFHEMMVEILSPQKQRIHASVLHEAHRHPGS